MLVNDMIFLTFVLHVTMIKKMQCSQCVGNVFYYLYGDVKLFITIRFLHKYFEKKTLITISFKQHYIDKWNTAINTTTKWNNAKYFYVPCFNEQGPNVGSSPEQEQAMAQQMYSL